jgi:ADP-ribose pyrophosphatase
MEKTLKSKLLHEGRHFSFLRDEVELPNGHRTHRDTVRHPGAVAIVPVLPDGRVVMVRQYRYAAGRELLEIPAGTLEPGEPPSLLRHERAQGGDWVRG